MSLKKFAMGLCKQFVFKFCKNTQKPLQRLKPISRIVGLIGKTRQKFLQCKEFVCNAKVVKKFAIAKKVTRSDFLQKLLLPHFFLNIKISQKAGVSK